MADLNCKAEESKETSRQTVVLGWEEGATDGCIERVVALCLEVMLN
jgi:hypothetical protein